MARMTMATLALLLLSSLAWSGLDAARKALGATAPAIPVVVALGLGQAALLAGWLAVTGLPALAPAFWWACAGSVALNVAGNFLFIRALALSPFSLTVPLLALTPVLSTGVAAAMLGEVPGPRQLAGIALIVGGAIGLQLPAEGGLRGLVAAMRAEPGARLMLGVVACWAVVGPFDKTATLASSPAFHGMAVNLGMGLALVPALLRPGQGLRPLAARPGLLLVACAVGVVAILAQFEVMRHALVSLVEAVKRMIGMLMAVAVGRLAFGEPVGGRKLAAIAVMCGGTALLLL